MRTTLVAAAFAAVVALAAAWLWRDASASRRDARARVLASEQTAFDRKAIEVERMLTQIYQGGRTLSLLPTVRGLTGGNLPAGFVAADGAKFDRARFSADAEATVQQIYNNLASNVSVSEVYAILDGFRPDRGETPFFMFDEVHVGGLSHAGAADDGDDDDHDADEPEESEAAEYAYYVDLLTELRQSHPRLDLAATPLDRIPAFTSAAMRTCDNAQYTSRSAADVRDATGFTVSVPIYRADTSLVGIISVIVRTNVFEAALRGEPFLLITDGDRQRARAEGWTPGAPARFVLRNVDRDVTIADRGFDLAAARRAGRGALIERALTTPLAERWTLELYVPAAALAASDGDILQAFGVRLAAIALVAALVAAWMVVADRQRRRIMATVGGIVRSAERVRTSAAEVATASDQLAAGAATQAASVEESSAAIEEIAASSRANAEHARATKGHVEQAGAVADEGAARMTELVVAMQGIRASSDEIARIVQVSDAIAFQTHVLALNAAVEAARAGEAGASFAVVASELRNLARRSAEAAQETTALIERATGSANRGDALTQQVQASLRVIVDRIHSTDELAAKIANASAEQARAVAQCNSAVAQVSQVAQDNAHTSDAVATAAAAATGHADDLVALAAELVGSRPAAAARLPTARSR
jgi:methyl-accepting chemotaxis protein